ncbi:SDR family oxidoreductase [Erythrobacteraceae bacterium CFH 75059]|uniref:SDR family oxidoreductase n=1 Tax=Qipengyuania thermophila TaxID=2509361 RepID=UPI0010206B96|nr:SDR family oxidoreductase [Qipengyuania thermophila]TCD06192.1 SDR family oxidoreductase [Erythrobacteraceae bacterium CFH 75059]
MAYSIFITGGASGIGLAMARLFAERGWFVGLADIDEAAMARAADTLPPGRVSTHRLDVRDREQWDEALTAFENSAGGQLHVVANNAGIPLGGDLAENSTAEIERCLDINLKGAIFGAQASLPFLRRTAPDACLLNTASAAGIYGTSGASVYSATKFGVRALTESLDGEWAAHGIRVRSLMPAFIDTPLLAHTPNARSNESIRQRVLNAGLEITPVTEVAEAAWQAVHGDRLHTLVGATARRMAFAARWMPARLRKMARAGTQPLGR